MASKTLNHFQPITYCNNCFQSKSIFCDDQENIFNA